MILQAIGPCQKLRYGTEGQFNTTGTVTSAYCKIKELLNVLEGKKTSGEFQFCFPVSPEMAEKQNFNSKTNAGIIVR